MASKETQVKRILMIGYSPNKGGVEAYVQNLCNSLPEGRYEIIHRARGMRIDGKLWQAPANRHRYLRYRFFWQHFFRENRFDAVYFNTCDLMSIDPLRFAKAAGVPVRIIHSHNTGNQQELVRMSLFHRISEHQNRRTIDLYATHLLACSDAAGVWMFGKKAFRVVHNGICVERYALDEDGRQYVREREKLGSGPVIGIIGRLEPQKNPMFALQVAKQILKKEPEAHFLFIGDGRMREQLEKQINAAGLKNQIRLTGAVDHVNEWMWAMDCVLMPSLFEGLPFVLVEAQAASLPCIVSANVSREADLTGLVHYVSLEDAPEFWAKQVLEACREPRIDRSADVMKAGYSMQNTAAEIAALLEEAFSTQ